MTGKSARELQLMLDIHWRSEEEYPITSGWKL
jgi:hypothetical protein